MSLTGPIPRLAAAAGRLRRFGRDRRGATAMEFAMVALPFLSILFGTLELGLIFLISTTLDNATTDAARTIRTGQMQTGGAVTAATFQQAICANMGWIQTTCRANLIVSVQPYTTFSNTNGKNAPITNGKMATQSQMPFSCGVPGQIVLVQAYFSWPLIAPGFDKALQRTSDGSTMITSAATFRNEPYVPGATAAC